MQLRKDRKVSNMFGKEERRVDLLVPWDPLLGVTISPDLDDDEAVLARHSLGCFEAGDDLSVTERS